MTHCGIYIGTCEELARLPFRIEPSNLSPQAVSMDLEIRYTSNQTLVWQARVNLQPNATASFEHSALRGLFDWSASVDGVRCSVKQAWGHGYQSWRPEVRADGSMHHQFMFDDYGDTLECGEPS